jgi:hypothetical protein
MHLMFSESRKMPMSFSSIIPLYPFPPCNYYTSKHAAVIGIIHIVFVLLFFPCIPLITISTSTERRK